MTSCLHAFENPNTLTLGWHKTSAQNIGKLAETKSLSKRRHHEVRVVLSVLPTPRSLQLCFLAPQMERALSSPTSLSSPWCTWRSILRPTGQTG